MESNLVHEDEGSHHYKYYLKDSVIFLVEDCLFKVPRYMLENTSPVFSSMLSLPSGQNQPEGQTDATPIRLLGTSRVDFEHLMEFLYPLTYDSLHQPVTRDESQWTSILRLARKWEMDEIRDMATTNLQLVLPSDTSPLKWILLGKEFDIPLWVKTGFTALCLREESLTEGEGQQLGLTGVVKVAAAREKIRKILYNQRYGHLGHHVVDVEDKLVDDGPARKVIDEILETGPELSEDRRGNSASLGGDVRFTLPGLNLHS